MRQRFDRYGPYALAGGAIVACIGLLVVVRPDVLGNLGQFVLWLGGVLVLGSLLVLMVFFFVLYVRADEREKANPKMSYAKCGNCGATTWQQQGSRKISSTGWAYARFTCGACGAVASLYRDGKKWRYRGY